MACVRATSSRARAALRCTTQGAWSCESGRPFLLQVVQLLISGIAQGCIYGLIALGFVLIYKATETVSFAQGELMMLGAFTAFAAMSLFGLPFWLAALLAVVAMAAFGVLLGVGVI